jgi:hypothetical protein
MYTGTFDLKKVNVIFGVAKITGYADGDAISIEEKEDAFKVAVGADGDADRIRNRANYLEIVLNILQTSPMNQILSAIHTADRAVGIPLPFLLKDNGGSTVIGAGAAWIKGFPKIAMGNDSKSKEWTIHATDYLINVGGN